MVEILESRLYDPRVPQDVEVRFKLPNGEEIWCDIGIAEEVYWLNTHGYSTHASCEGHERTEPPRLDSGNIPPSEDCVIALEPVNRDEISKLVSGLTFDQQYWKPRYRRFPTYSIFFYKDDFTNGRLLIYLENASIDASRLELVSVKEFPNGTLEVSIVKDFHGQLQFNFKKTPVILTILSNKKHAEGFRLAREEVFAWLNKKLS